MEQTISETKHNPRAFFFAALVFEMVFLMAARTPLDSDFWWHLATGEQTLKNGWPVLADTFSYTRAGMPWINHSWLGEVILALAYRVGGWAGLSALVALLAAGSMLLIYRQMAGHPIWRAFVIVLGALAAAPVWSSRPQMFSLLLLAWLSDLLYRYWVEGQDRLYWLPVLFILWSNLHGGYPLGLILLGCTLAGGLIDSLMNRSAIDRGKILRLGMWSGVCVLAVLINPNGLNMWRIPFQTVGVSVLQQAIPEWASPDFHDTVQQPFLLLLAGLVAALGLAGRPARSGGLIGGVVFAVMALAARRNFAPFALAACPVLATAGWQVIERLRSARGAARRLQPARNGPEMRPGLQRGIDMAIVGVLALACVVKLAAATMPSTIDQYLPDMFPVKAAEWVKENRPAGRLFNEYGWGGYLIWALPEYPVFVDGRTDLFGDEIIGEWLKVMGAEDGWQAVLERWEVRLVMAVPGQALEEALKGAGWRQLYQDDTAVVYGR